MKGIENGLDGDEVEVGREIEVDKDSSDKAGIEREVDKEEDREDVCRDGSMKVEGDNERVEAIEVIRESALVRV